MTREEIILLIQRHEKLTKRYNKIYKEIELLVPEIDNLRWTLRMEYRMGNPIFQEETITI